MEKTVCAKNTEVPENMALEARKSDLLKTAICNSYIWAFAVFFKHFSTADPLRT